MINRLGVNEFVQSCYFPLKNKRANLNLEMTKIWMRSVVIKEIDIKAVKPKKGGVLYLKINNDKKMITIW